MKNKLIIFATLIFASITSLHAQEKYGKTLNIGVGPGYSVFYNSTNTAWVVAPAINVNYEFDVARNFTLAPSISFAYARGYRYWGDPQNSYRDYSYYNVEIPVGVKGTYYFDELFQANDKWDFYAAASAGIAYRHTVWESEYRGEENYFYGSVVPAFLNLHIGTELHLTKSLGISLDLSTGMSTFGAAIHF